MKDHWRKLYALLPLSFEKKIYKKYFTKQHKNWLRKGVYAPSSHLAKQKKIKYLSVKHLTSILVETGTYMGDMLYALQDDFKKLYSIELSDLFYWKAVKRFRKNKKIKLIHGDSGKKLAELMPQLTEPVLFWLDGHYSGGITAKGDKDCPVYEELEAIFQSQLDHVIIIDDARLFDGTNDYPELSELQIFVKAARPFYGFIVENDSIQLTPQKV